MSGGCCVYRDRVLKAAVRASHADDDFAARVTFLKIPDGVSSLTQRVTSIDNRCDFAGFKQLFHTPEIRRAWSRQQVAHLLPPGHRDERSQEHRLDHLR